MYENGRRLTKYAEKRRHIDEQKKRFLHTADTNGIQNQVQKRIIFITAYFVHNYKFNRNCWLTTPYSVYWKGKIYFKANGVATFKPQVDEEKKFSNNIDKAYPPEIAAKAPVKKIVVPILKYLLHSGRQRINNSLSTLKQKTVLETF